MHTFISPLLICIFCVYLSIAVPEPPQISSYTYGIIYWIFTLFIDNLILLVVKTLTTENGMGKIYYSGSTDSYRFDGTLHPSINSKD